jgi:hypothetical protein
LIRIAPKRGKNNSFSSEAALHLTDNRHLFIAEFDDDAVVSGRGDFRLRFVSDGSERK